MVTKIHKIIFFSLFVFFQNISYSKTLEAPALDEKSVYNYFTLLFIENTAYEVLTFGTIFFITFRLLFTLVALICGISFIMLGKPSKKYTLSNYNEY